MRAWLPLVTPLLLPEAYRLHDRRCDAELSKQERRSARSPGEIKRFEDFWESCRSCDRRVGPREPAQGRPKRVGALLEVLPFSTGRRINPSRPVAVVSRNRL